jgi:SAM-dependent methyltransferase
MADEPSDLGKREHWEAAYSAELTEFRASDGVDCGEVWFGEDTQATMVAFVGQLADAEPSRGGRAAWRVLDLGCGNGALSVALAHAGCARCVGATGTPQPSRTLLAVPHIRLSFSKLLGVDYVPAAVELSRSVAGGAGVTCARFQVRTQGCPSALAVHARFQEDDVLNSALTSESVDLAVDKGTFDAVGLAADGARARVRYLASVARLLPPAGLLVVTSCNSTADELTAEFCAAGLFAEHERVKTYPVFRFGGREGCRVCTVAFARTSLPLS